MSERRESTVVNSASAIILAGGRSARMGQPKATLLLGGITLIERTVIELARAEKDPQMKKEIVSKLSKTKSKEATDYLMELIK